jgi:hypothetical protein
MGVGAECKDAMKEIENGEVGHNPITDRAGKHDAPERSEKESSHNSDTTDIPRLKKGGLIHILDYGRHVGSSLASKTA